VLEACIARDIHVQEVARAGPSYLFAGSFSALGGLEIPALFKTFQTVEWQKPVAAPTSLGPQPVFRRQAQILCCRCFASSRGDVFGREERS
jgi:hypothetical protein